MSTGTLLILDDDRSFAEKAGRLATEVGFDPYPVTTIRDALEAATSTRFDFALLDIGLPDGCGLDLLTDVRLSRTWKIVMSGNAELAQWAGRRVPGTLGSLAKPFRFSRFRELVDAPRPRAGWPAATGLLGESAPMRQAIDDLCAVGASRFPVLIHGETGTGKELGARTIHASSGRNGKFVAVNCASITAELLMSQLFGHRRGSFTGAVETHEGLVAEAEGGTLFLDELTEAPAAVQSALLRFLESREILPLGARDPRIVDVRIVAATNMPPDQAMAEGRLRPDLYYRVAGYEVVMPALRDRREDVPVIARAMLEQLNAEYGTYKRFGPGAFASLEGHPWHGNVRELRQIVQKAFLGDGEILQLAPRRAHIPAAPHQQTVVPLEQVERDAIEQAIRVCGGDRTRAARLLGVSTKTIYNKLARYRDSSPTQCDHCS
jgi:DNA-binding NtrC family response regulator